MKFTLSWLKQYLDTSYSVEDLDETLSKIGLEVEEVKDIGAIYSQFIVAEIREATQHPNADKLKVCSVFDGKDTLQVVCGASNARRGIKVVLAPIGSEIPANNMVMKACKIRGVESFGMLCAADELGVSEQSDGIIELSQEAEVGSTFAEYMNLNDIVFDLNITPNRGDCTSVRGIARDLAAAGKGELRKLEIPQIESLSDRAPVDFNYSAPESCNQIYFRYIAGIGNKVSTPSTISSRLGMVGINNNTALVDISNYAMLSLGRPNHIYDADKIEGTICVRLSEEGEEFIALGNEVYKLPAGILVVADSEKILSIAGVIGGEESKVTEQTKNILIEVGHFDPIAIYKAGSKLKIHSEARFRFERRVDYANSESFMDYLTGLINKHCEGQNYPIEKVVSNIPEYTTKVAFNIETLNDKIGMEYGDSEVKQILETLGIGLKSSQAAIPSWRQGDIEKPEDLVEEVARIVGYDTVLDQELPSFSGYLLATDQVTKLKNTLAYRGLNELINWSFCSSKTLQKMGMKSNLPIANPITNKLDVMRPTLIANMLEVVASNQARSVNNIGFFEVGNIYNAETDDMQSSCVAGIRAGTFNHLNPHLKERKVDFFDAKSDLFSVIAEAGLDPNKLLIDKQAPSYYHPGRCASFSLGRKLVGYCGELHPQAIGELEINGPVIAFEIFLNELPSKKKVKKAQIKLSQFQEVRRDFAFIVDTELETLKLVQAIRKADKGVFTDIRVFDIHTGGVVPQGKKSVAVAVKMQPKEQTFTDAEIEQISNAVVTAAEKNCGAELRS